MNQPPKPNPPVVLNSTFGTKAVSAVSVMSFVIMILQFFYQNADAVALGPYEYSKLLALLGISVPAGLVAAWFDVIKRIIELVQRTRDPEEATNSVALTPVLESTLDVQYLEDLDEEDCLDLLQDLEIGLARLKMSLSEKTRAELLQRMAPAPKSKPEPEVQEGK